MKRYVERPREVKAEQWRGPGHELLPIRLRLGSGIPGIHVYPQGRSGALTPINPGYWLVEDDNGYFAYPPAQFKAQFTEHPLEARNWEGLEKCPVKREGKPCLFAYGHTEPCAFEGGWHNEPTFRRGETKRDLWERLKEDLHSGKLVIDWDWGLPGGDLTVYWPTDAALPVLQAYRPGRPAPTMEEPYRLPKASQCTGRLSPVEHLDSKVGEDLLIAAIRKPERLKEQNAIEHIGVEMDADPAEGRTD